MQFYENCHKFEIMVVSLALFFEEMELMQSGPASDSSQDCPPTAGCTTPYSHHTKPVQAHFCGDLKGIKPSGDVAPANLAHTSNVRHRCRRQSMGGKCQTRRMQIHEGGVGNEGYEGGKVR